MDLKVSIDNSMIKKIDSLSNGLEIERNDFIVKALRKFIFITELQTLRKKVKPKAKKLGFKTEQDIFNAVS